MHPERSALLAVCIVLPVLTLVSVFLRFVARSSRKLPLLVDDWTALTALVLNIASSIVAVYAVNERGFGLAPTLFRPHDLVPAFKLLYAYMLLVYLTFGIIKVSFVCFYKRVFPTPRLLLICNILIAGVICWTIPLFVIQALTSWTIPQFWNTKVIDYRAFNIAMAVLDLVLDILILLLPIQPFLTAAQDIATSNSLWLAVESNMSVIAACLPTLGAHFRSRLGLSADRSQSKAYSLRVERIAGFFDRTVHPRTTSSASSEARTPWVPLQEHSPKAMIDRGAPKDGGNAYRSHPRSGIMVDRTFDLEHAVRSFKTSHWTFHTACIPATMVDCPICGKPVKESAINLHIDSGCESHVESPNPSQPSQANSSQVTDFFKRPSNKHIHTTPNQSSHISLVRVTESPGVNGADDADTRTPTGSKRPATDHGVHEDVPTTATNGFGSPTHEPPVKRVKPSTALQKAAPLAERMRPRNLDEVCGQELVGPDGVLRGLIETDRVPSMLLWGGAGTGKTTIARVISSVVGSRFLEINSTSSGVGECKKIFAEAGNELRLTGRKTIIFCDEIHRFSKSQQDVFLGPVESGQVTLIGATTENPSFKVQTALLSRCRTFTLQKLTDADVTSILERALEIEGPNYAPSPLVDTELIHYLSAFADGDARTALNLLELAMDISKRPSATKESIRAALTKTLVYDRAGDQHSCFDDCPSPDADNSPPDDTISALHKSIRGSHPHASLYYLSRMLSSGEDPLYIARRLVVIASEDVGLADNTLLPLATATYTACEKIGMPECRINLAHCVSALALAKKSTRSYRGLANAESICKEPGMAGLPVPMHLRNAPTRLMKELGAGREYKYNPRFRNGKVKQEYLPEKLVGSVFFEENDLGDEVDEELEDEGDDGDAVEDAEEIVVDEFM
ncbi:MAG: hypothetical protein L6R35_006333 [Caloplaca aegaea]|nr:MAG: hypothetical protein L6R35_006333 [Caloplaca aegaea]